MFKMEGQEDSLWNIARLAATNLDLFVVLFWVLAIKHTSWGTGSEHATIHPFSRVRQKCLKQPQKTLEEPPVVSTQTPGSISLSLHPRYQISHDF